MTQSYQVCSRCILDTHDDPQIEFDSSDVCNHCREYDRVITTNRRSDKNLKKDFDDIVSKIKKWGKNRRYDCIVGLSGGVDSTYLAWLVKQANLRPLVVHFDNGWNSERAVKNIENVLKSLHFDLYTYVMDWAEMKDIQIAYFLAGVLDLDVPSDHGFLALLYQTARKHNIKYILSGHNSTDEFILPKSMIWSKRDLANLKSIHKKYGKKKLRTLPILSFWQSTYYQFTNRFEMIRLLDHISYNKMSALEIIKRELSWKEYGGKHYENIFTRFFQGYILPVKFKVDKRKAHYSNLICSGQITREQALKDLAKPIYDPDQLKADRDFFLKKLEFTPDWFEDYLTKPPVSHLAFDSYAKSTYVYYDRLLWVLRPFIGLAKRVKRNIVR